MKKVLAFLMLLLSSMAQAQAQGTCLVWDYDLNGIRLCTAQDFVNLNNRTLTFTGGGTISAAPEPKCDAGETLVLVPSGSTIASAMCARDLKPARE